MATRHLPRLRTVNVFCRKIPSLCYSSIGSAVARRYVYDPPTSEPNGAMGIVCAHLATPFLGLELHFSTDKELGNDL
jgi:hypothetical protein